MVYKMFRNGFTIIELLVVIVVISVIVSISIVSYSTVSQRASVSSIKSDLVQASKSLDISKNSSTEGVYPVDLSSVSLASSGNNVFSYYTPESRRSFCLSSTSNSTTFSITNLNPSPVQSSCIYNGMVAWLRFNGNTADSSDYSNTATAMSGAAPTVGQSGVANTAYLFDGIDDYVYIDNKESLNPPYVTISLWVNRSGYNTSLCNILRRDSGDAYSIMCGTNNDTVWFKMKNVLGGWYLTSLTAVTFPLNTWTHLVGTFDGSKVSIYKNGSLGSQVSGTQSILYAGGQNLVIGRDDPSTGRYFKGSIDDVRIYGRALSLVEIQALYAAGAQ